MWNYMKGKCNSCGKEVDETQQTAGNCHDCDYRINNSRISISLNRAELLDLCSITELYRDVLPDDQKVEEIDADYYQKRFYAILQALDFGIFSNWNLKEFQ